MTRKRLLTGVRASGSVHLGNYLGAMKPAVEAQGKYENYLFIADLHALTTQPTPEELQNNARSVAAAWLACGVDPEKTILWKQSDVPEVLELAYLLTCVTGFGLLERAHSFKDAKAKSKNIKAGVFYYPVLMAADILLYEADLVPVGRDQMQHLEMTRDMATFFNETYGPTLKLPEALAQEGGDLVPGIDGRKMSKSYHNALHIFADEAVLKKEVMKIVTDSKALEEPKIAEDCLVYQIYSLVAPPQQAAEMREALGRGGYGYGTAKKELLQVLLSSFDTMRERYFMWMKNPEELDACLTQGAIKAREKARNLMARVKAQIGL